MVSPRVCVLVRPGCHLCEDALQVVHQVAAKLGEDVEVIDIDAAGDPDLLDRHSEQVPVVLVDGRVHDFWRVDADRLTRALTRTV
jgi:glutaredoxin